LIERIEYVEGILIIQSLAGGTGSGLGSYLTKTIKQNYKLNIINMTILPYQTGEVIL